MILIFGFFFAKKKSKNQNYLSPAPSFSGEELTYFFTAHLLTMSSAMQFLTPETTAQRQLADDSIMDEGLLSDYVQKLKIHPKPLHIQACQWDEAHQHLKGLIFKE
jgi:hypothetical protein